MNKDIFESLKELYPPTPRSFSEGVDGALGALPEKTTRWRMPVASLAAYAAAACAVAALLITLAANPSASPNAANSSSVFSTALAAGGGQTARPSALAQLPVSTPGIVDSEDGWQVADVSDAAVWYFNPHTSQIARLPGTAISLDLALGQKVDADTFVAAVHGECIAFTAHGPKGDSVWIVSANGRKAVVPGDVQWYDAVDEDRPLKFDFTGLTLLPACFGYDSSTSQSEQSSVTTYSLNGLYASALAANGNTYYLSISIADNTFQYGMFRGYVLEGEKLKLPDDTAVTDGRFGVPLKMRKTADGSYCIGADKQKVFLQSNKFAFFKPQNVVSMFRYHLVLFIYRDDPSRSLWVLDRADGRAEKVAEGCVAAGWLGNGDYWFTREGQKGKYSTGSVKYDKPISVLATLVVYGDTADDGKMTAAPRFLIVNHSDRDIAVPDTIPCTLRLMKDGRQVWSKNDGIALKQLQLSYCESIYGGGFNACDTTAPFAIKPGYLYEAELSRMVTIDGPGDYVLEGTLYDGSSVKYEFTYPATYPLPRNIGIDAEIKPGGRLSITIVNHSINGFTIPQTSIYEIGNIYPPVVCYRLTSRGKEVGKGMLPMSENLLRPEEAILPAGGRVTFTDPSEAPRFAGLPPGDYVLECFVMYSTYDEKLPWGMAAGLYFDLKFTVPDK